MKILMVSDLHGQKRCLDHLDQLIHDKKVDFLVCAGDITQFDDISYLEKFLSVIRKGKLGAAIVWGNNDQGNVRKKILHSPYNIHLKPMKQGDWTFFGISEIEDIPVIKPDDIKGNILVTHRPPLFTQLKMKLPNAPRYHISGHVHHAAQIRKFPSTTLVQIPSLTLGRYAIFDPDQETAEFFHV